MTYSYDPTQINDGGLNQARFTIGDVFVKEPEKDSYLSDEEYLAVLSTDDSWKRKMLRLVETLLLRFSYEVDTEIREAKWSLHQRVDFWEKLRKRLADEIAEEDSAAAFGFMGRKQRPPAFWVGQFDNRRIRR